MRDTDTLAWRLKLEREQRGWSQEHVAELLRGYGLEAANAWLRRHFRVWVEANEVVAIQIL